MGPPWSTPRRRGTLWLCLIVLVQWRIEKPPEPGEASLKEIPFASGAAILKPEFSDKIADVFRKVVIVGSVEHALFNFPFLWTFPGNGFSLGLGHQLATFLAEWYSLEISAFSISEIRRA